MSNGQNISSTGNGGKEPLNADELQAYLEGNLSAERQHALEQWLEEEGMESDAMDGLQSLAPDEVKSSVSAINYQLQRQLGVNRTRRKRPITENKWAWIAVAVVLFLCLLAYGIIAMVK